MRLRVILLAVLPAILACRQKPDLRLPGAEIPENASFTIRVVNNNALDMVLYVTHDSHRERLGNATASTTANFEFRIRRLGAGREFSLYADPIGGRIPVRTETFLARDGQVVTWTIETDLRRSHTTVF